ncbi:MAG: hypothetical protein LH481_14185 [Burkholderiales bacterium]|nr:hypothetical protein [Burkholderiales bacterium]
MNLKLHAAPMAGQRFLNSALMVAVAGVLVFAISTSSNGKSMPALIDDSATVVLDATPTMNWRSVTPKSRDNAIVGRTRVNVKLATTPWLGKSGRIYMVLPAESTGSIKIAWRGNGLLLDGQLVPGGRTLVYSGTIREKRMEDVLDVRIEADGVRLSNVQQLRFHFEIDVE